MKNNDKNTPMPQCVQTSVMVSSLNRKWAILREEAVKVAEINAIRHCLELYADFEISDEEVENAVSRYRTGN
jgi:predicted mannosyl-3-phosphoglycerate phosphatase (HAD superfamily)